MKKNKILSRILYLIILSIVLQSCNQEETKNVSEVRVNTDTVKIEKEQLPIEIKNSENTDKNIVLDQNLIPDENSSQGQVEAPKNLQEIQTSPREQEIKNSKESGITQGTQTKEIEKIQEIKKELQQINFTKEDKGELLSKEKIQQDTIPQASKNTLSETSQISTQSISPLPSKPKETPVVIQPKLAEIPPIVIPEIVKVPSISVLPIKVVPKIKLPQEVTPENNNVGTLGRITETIKNTFTSVVETISNIVNSPEIQNSDQIKDTSNVSGSLSPETPLLAPITIITPPGVIINTPNIISDNGQQGTVVNQDIIGSPTEQGGLGLIDGVGQDIGISQFSEGDFSNMIQFPITSISSRDGISMKLNGFQSGNKLKSPLTLIGKIHKDFINYGLFSVEILDEEGNNLKYGFARAFFSEEEADIKSKMVYFIIELDFTRSSLQGNTSGFLRFTEDNVSLPFDQRDFIKIPVTF